MTQAKPRFHCSIPGCDGLLASGENLWEHVAAHNARAAERRQAELENAVALVETGEAGGDLPTRYRCLGCQRMFPFQWQLRNGYCRACQL
jgi:hypothetical protein